VFCFSDTTVSRIMLHRHNICSHSQDPLLHASEASVQVEREIPFISNNAKVDVGYSSLPRFNQVESPNFQFLQSATHFLPLHTPLNPATPLHPPSHHLLHQTNHMCPVYLVPVTVSTQASMNVNLSSINSHLPRSSHNYLTHPETAPCVQVPYNENQEPQTYQSQSQDISITSVESPESGNQLDNNLTRDQIYKSQPPPPPLPSKHQTMGKPTTKLFSEPLPQLHVDSLKLHQTQTSQPQ